MSVPPWFHRSIIFPTSERDRETVLHVQRILRVPETGSMDEPTRSHLRGFQSLFGMRPTGVIDEQTAIKIEAVRSMYSVQ